MRLYNNEQTTIINGRPAVVEGDKVYYLVLRQDGEYKYNYDWYLVEEEN